MIFGLREDCGEELFDRTCPIAANREDLNFSIAGAYVVMHFQSHFKCLELQCFPTSIAILFPSQSLQKLTDALTATPSIQT